LKGNTETLLWEIEGEIRDVKRSAERQSILDALTKYPQGLTPKEIAAKTGKTGVSVRFLLKQMLDCGDTSLA
jgi:IclR helix-turn-helix domain